MASAVLDLVQSVPPGVASVLKVVPFVGSAVNFTMLSTVLGPRALSELREPPYRIADDTAKALIDAGVGLIPGGGLPVAMFKLASAWLEAANADFPGEWSEWAVNGVVAAAPEVSVGVLSFFNDPTGIYGTQERNRAYQNLVEALNVSGLVQAAISGDRAAQGLIEAGLTDSILIEPMTRPPEYWHQRAQLLLVKLKGDLTGTFDGTPLQGPAGFYEGWVGKEYVEGLVGVVDYTSGTTYQFGTQGNWAGSALGNDLYWGTASNDFFAGMTGDDVIYGFEGYDTLKGELGRDTIYAGANADWAWGGDHDDLIYGEAGDDRLFGEADNDTLDGGADNDEMWGGEGADVLSGGTGQDTLYGEAGADTLIGDDDSERDLLSGGADFDTYFAGANDVIIDSDQYGQVSFQGSRVTGGILDTRVSPNGRDSEGNVHYISLDGATSLVYNAAAATLLVTKNGKSFTVNDFRPTNAYDIDGTSLNPGQKSTFATALNIKLVDVPNGNIANDLASTVLAAAGATPIRRWDPLVLDLNADGILGT